MARPGDATDVTGGPGTTDEGDGCHACIVERLHARRDRAVSLIGVDWSAEAFRAVRLAGDGTVSRSPASAATACVGPARRGHEETLVRQIGRWLEADTVVVLALSTGDRSSWIETPFLDGPVDLARLCAGATRRPLRESTLVTPAGDRTARPGRSRTSCAARRCSRSAPSAIRRGVASGVCWSCRGRARVGSAPPDGHVETFRTMIGGELLEGLLDAPFGKPMAASETSYGPPFLDVSSGATGAATSSPICSPRGRPRCLDETNPSDARARLAGLVLGNEIREAETGARGRAAKG